MHLSLYNIIIIVITSIYCHNNNNNNNAPISAFRSRVIENFSNDREGGVKKKKK